MKYKDMFSCKGMVAVVTGASGLIGRELIKGLSEAGAYVYGADLKNNEDNIKGCGVDYLTMDISNEISIKQGIEKVIKTKGTIDILVNSAYPRTQDWGNKFEEVTFKSWQDNINAHLGGYFLCSQIVAQQMKKQRRGSIINIASIYGMGGADFSLYEGTEMTMPAAYSIIKAGVINFSRYLATYYGPYKVRVNTVSPGGVFNNQPSNFVKKYSKKTPLRRMAFPYEIVGAVVFLASPASSYITGHNLVVDGGYTVC